MHSGRLKEPAKEPVRTTHVEAFHTQIIHVSNDNYINRDGQNAGLQRSRSKEVESIL